MIQKITRIQSNVPVECPVCHFKLYLYEANRRFHVEYNSSYPNVFYRYEFGCSGCHAGVIIETMEEISVDENGFAYFNNIVRNVTPVNTTEVIKKEPEKINRFHVLELE